MADILKGSLNEGHAPRSPAFLLHMFESAKRQPRLPLGFIDSQAPLHALLTLMLQMEPQLLVELTLHSVPAEQRPDAK
jgi:hypothetical protein